MSSADWGTKHNESMSDRRLASSLHPRLRVGYIYRRITYIDLVYEYLDVFLLTMVFNMYSILRYLHGIIT